MRLPPLHLLLPSSLPDDPTLWRDLELPALARLLAKAPRIDAVRGDDFQRATGHERWLAECYGLDDAVDAPLAPFMLLGDGGQPSADEDWICVQPVHVEVTRDHLRLHPPHVLALSAADAHALRQAADASFTERGLRLVAPTPWRWYASAVAPVRSADATAADEPGRASGTPGAFVAASTAKASGRSIDLWLPKTPTAARPAAPGAPDTGGTARRWLALQNEVQMAWYDHPINDRRSPAANSVWLHGHGRYRRVTGRYARVFSNMPAALGLGLASGAAIAATPRDFMSLVASVDSLARASPPGTPARPGRDARPWLVECDALLTATLADDAHAWREAIAELERTWFAPVLAALADGSLPAVDLVMTGDVEARVAHLRRGDLRRFWRRRSLLACVANGHGTGDQASRS